MTYRRPLVMMLTIALLAGCDREHFVEHPPMPVRTETAARADFAPTVTLLGVVRAGQSVPLTVQQHGVVSYPARFAGGLRTGERVRRGETVAIVRNDEVVHNQTQARLQLDDALGDFDRVKRSHDAGLVSARELAAAQLRAALARETYANASREVSTLRLTSPAGGTLVVTKAYAPGTAIDPANVLAEVVTGGALVVESNVAAADRALLRPSLIAHFTARTSPPWSGSGHVAEVASVVDAAGTARVVSAIDGGAAVPPPGTGVEVRVELDHRRDVLTAPEDALVAGGDGPALFVLGAPEGPSTYHVKRLRVETGGRANGRVEITSGLRDGDRIVVSGADGLAEDALVAETR